MQTHGTDTTSPSGPCDHQTSAHLIQMSPEGADVDVARTIELGREVTASRVARRWLASELDAAGVRQRLGDDRFESVSLMVSEVVTNVIVHTTSEAVLHLSIARTRVTVSVHDDDARLPEPRTADAESPGGRGLLIVAGLAHRWGVEPMPPHGKRVWFTVLLGR